MDEREKKRQEAIFQREWERDAKLRAEFGDNLAAFLAYRTAEAAGKVRFSSNRPQSA